jgi:hypothetical protein
VGYKKHVISGDVDNRVICEMFGAEFLKSFTNSWSENAALRKLKYVCDNVNLSPIVSTVFRDNEINDAIDYIKCGKGAGLDGVVGECIKYPHPNLCVLVKQLFDACCTPMSLITFVGVRSRPSRKKGNVCSSYGDFRLISCVNALAKMFEYCILKKMETSVCMHELQLGLPVVGGVRSLCSCLRE